MRSCKKFMVAFFIFAALTINYLIPSFALALEAILVESLGGDKLIGKLNQPLTLFVGEEKKRLYIADTGNNRLLSFDSEFNFLAEFDAGGTLKHPISFVKNSHGQFILIGGEKSELVFIDIPKKIYRPFKLSGVPKRGNPLSLGRLAIDKDDTLFITDKGSGRILVVNSEGQFIREMMYKNKPVDFSDVCLDENGYIYSLSTLKGKIFIFNKKGELITSFGKRGYGKHEFLFPTSIAVDNNGLIYILDQHKGNVLVFSNDGKFQFNFAKKGWGAGELYLPSYIYADNQGKIYIVDRGNNRVQVFQIAIQ